MKKFIRIIPIIIVILVAALLVPKLVNKNETDSSADSSAGESVLGVVTESESEKETESELPPEPERVTISINAVGDCTFGANQYQGYEKSFHQYYDKYGEDYFMENVIGIFQSDDLTIANCEGTLTEAKDPNTSRYYYHKGRPEYARIFTRSSIEMVTLGNNHLMDYLQQGIDDTISNIDNEGIVYAMNSKYGIHSGIYETKGIKIGVVSVNECMECEKSYDYFEDGYKELTEKGCNLIIAAPHWGGNKTHEIETDQIKLGHWLVDMGYDIVLGCHPHVLQGIEYYGDAYIVYSMGNFCYGGNDNPKEKDSMIFQMEFTFVDGVLSVDETVVKALPARLSSTAKKNDYKPVLLHGDEAEEWLSHLNKYCKQFKTEFAVDGSRVK